VSAISSTANLEDGHLLLPAFAEPHAHLDKAFLAERVENVTGDLLGAIEAMRVARPSITLADTIERAERAARLLAANGCTAIRSHVDLTLEGGLTSVEALLEVRRRLAGVVDIQVCALCAWPSVGPEGAAQRALLQEAIAMGVDVVGGCPHLEPDPAAANESFLAIAAEAGLPVDLHTDETLNAEMLALEDLAERVVASGFPHPVAASHCVSLCLQTTARQQEVAEKVAAAGISVIALPHTNLFLQGRDCPVAMPRGVTAVRALRAAGVNVAAGADNLQDPFNPVGRGDPLETAALMVMTAHVLPADALHMISGAARQAMGLPPTCDQVAVGAATVREAIAFGPPDRAIVRNGVTSETERSRDRR
jgi:cytosine deaminase